MRNKGGKLRILLDTSFLLPTLGIDVGDDVRECLERLNNVTAELHYSRFSLLEALWIAARLVKSGSFDMERFVQGLRSIVESGRYVKVNEDYWVFKEALEMYVLGHKDMIDNILYATSTSLNLKLLTVDSELKEFIRTKGLKDTIILPGQMDQ